MIEGTVKVHRYAHMFTLFISSTRTKIKDSKKNVPNKNILQSTVKVHRYGVVYPALYALCCVPHVVLSLLCASVMCPHIVRPASCTPRFCILRCASCVVCRLSHIVCHTILLVRPTV